MINQTQFELNVELFESSIQSKDFLNATLYLVSLIEMAELIQHAHQTYYPIIEENHNSILILIKKWMTEITSIGHTIEIEEKQALLQFSLGLFDYFVFKFFPNIEPKEFREKIYLSLAKYNLFKYEESYDKKKLIQSLHYLTRGQLITNKLLKVSTSPEVKNLKITLEDLKKKVILLRGDYRSNIADYFLCKNETREALIYLRRAYANYKYINHSKKMRSTKEKYLKLSLDVANLQRKLAHEHFNKKEYKTTLFHFQMAKKIFKQIKAKKEITEVSNEIKEYQEKIGDFLYEVAKLIPVIEIHDLRIKKGQLENIKFHYEEAQESRKSKKISNELLNLKKKLSNQLIQEIDKAKNNNLLEYQFYNLELLNKIYQEMGEIKKSKDIISKMKNLENQIDLQKLNDIRLKNESSRQDYTMKTNSQNLKTTLINNLPDGDNQEELLQETQISRNSNKSPDETDHDNLKQTILNFSNEKATYFQRNDPYDLSKSSYFVPSTKKDSISNLNSLKSIIKNFNNKIFLNDEEINFLKDFGINLPDNNDYYHNYPNNDYQFYPFMDKSGEPKVLLIPMKSFTKKQSWLGLIANKFDPYLPVMNNSVEFYVILKVHIEFALSSPTWESLFNEAELTTFHAYLFFLEAMRMKLLNIQTRDVAKMVNSSIIEEHLGINSGELKDLINKIPHISSLFDILSRSFTIDAKLFLMGMYLIEKNEMNSATALMSMVRTS